MQRKTVGKFFAKKKVWLSMKKAVRQGVSLMAAVLVGSMSMFGGTTVFAEDNSTSMLEGTTVSAEDESNYIRFVNSGNERMDADGSFEFMFQDWVGSDHFTADGTSITITTTARMYVYTDTYYFDSSKYIYRLTLYKENGTFDKKIGYYEACGDGISGSERFVGIEKGEEYYFKLEVMKPYIDGTAYHFEGTGQVSNVTVI